MKKLWLAPFIDKRLVRRPLTGARQRTLPFGDSLGPSCHHGAAGNEGLSRDLEGSCGKKDGGEDCEAAK